MKCPRRVKSTAPPLSYAGPFHFNYRSCGRALFRTSLVIIQVYESVHLILPPLYPSAPASGFQ